MIKGDSSKVRLANAISIMIVLALFGAVLVIIGIIKLWDIFRQWIR